MAILTISKLTAMRANRSDSKGTTVSSVEKPRSLDAKSDKGSGSDKDENKEDNTEDEKESPHPFFIKSAKSKETDTTKRNVYIKCVFLKIEDINTIQETFSGLVFVRATWREAKLDDPYNKAAREACDVNWEKMWSPELDINNIIGEPKVQLWKELEYSSDGKCFVVEKRKVKATFTEPMELEEFPFDVQDLSLLITSELSTSEVELLEDDEELSKIETLGFVNESQWKLLNFVHVESKVAENEFDQKYRKPGLFFRCCVIRRCGFFVYNIMVVKAIICSLSFVTFSIDKNKPQNRLQLVFLLLISAVAFKFAASQSVPRISYLTHLDRYILGSMIFLFLVAVYHSTIDIISDAYGASAAVVDFWVFIGFISLFGLLHLLFVLQVVLRGCRRRREVYRREKTYLKKLKEHGFNDFMDTCGPGKDTRFSTVV